VAPRVETPTGLAPEQTGRGGGGGYHWSPPTAKDHERDKLIGRRGEEIVYRHEIDRITAVGHPASRVIWTSEQDPGADHDIRSVDDDGADLWIEVKSTTGRDGRFLWSKPEFDKARLMKDHYLLVRVYEAATDHPTLKYFRDPINLLLQEEMRLGINALQVEVEGMNSSVRDGAMRSGSATNSTP